MKPFRSTALGILGLVVAFSSKKCFGKNEGISPDIDKENYFKCGKCHKAEEMHGDGTEYANRYDFSRRKCPRSM